ALTGGQNGTVVLWELEKGIVLSRRLRGGGHSVQCVALSPDGGQGLSGERDKVVYLWDLGKDKKNPAAAFQLEEWATCVTFSPTGAKALAGGINGNVYLIDLKERKKLRSWQAGRDSVTCVAFSLDGSL